MPRLAAEQNRSVRPRPFSRRKTLSGRRDSFSGTAAELRGPLYAADGAGPPAQGGFGYSGLGRDRTVSVTVRHTSADGGELEVTTADEDRWAADHDDWRLTHDWLSAAVGHAPIRFPLTLTAERWEQDVPVDGAAVTFVFVGGPSTWRASGSVAGWRVAVGGNNWLHDRVSLVSVDPGNVPAPR